MTTHTLSHDDLAVSDGVDLLQLVLDQAVEAYRDVKFAPDDKFAIGRADGLVAALAAMLSANAIPAFALVVRTAEAGR